MSLHLVICPYCEQRAELVRGSELYPHRPDLAERFFYRCSLCDAYVGCHAARPAGFGDYVDGTKPLGRLANAELRKAKAAVHAIFDPLWKEGDLTRTDAYRWLAKAMALTPVQAHIGLFDIAQCNRAIEAVAAHHA